MRSRLVLTLAMFTLLAGGCATNLVSHRANKAEFRAHPRIAILPFENLSGEAQVGSKVTDYFQILMAAEGPYDVIEAGLTMELLRQQRIRLSTQLTNEQIVRLASELKADYLVIGTVLEFQQDEDQFLGSIPEVTFSTRLVDCASQQTVWAGVSNGSGNKGELLFGVGAIRSADQLVQQMVQNTVHTIAKLFSK